MTSRLRPSTLTRGSFWHLRRGSRRVSSAAPELRPGRQTGSRWLIHVKTVSASPFVSVADGNVRRLPTTLNYVVGLNWSPDSRFVVTRATDLRGRNGIFRVDVQSGESQAIALGSGLSQSPQYSRDGKLILFNRNDVAVEFDVDTRAERVSSRSAPIGQLSPRRPVRHDGA